MSEGFDFRQWVENHPDAQSLFEDMNWEQEADLMSTAVMEARTSTTVDLPPILTVEDIASFLRLQEATVRAWLRAGVIPAMHLGGRWRVERGTFQQWLADAQRQKPTPVEDIPAPRVRPSVPQARRRTDGSGPRR